MAREKVTTPEFRVAFPHLFRPRKPQNGSAGEPKFELVMVFDKNTDLSALKKLAQDAAKEKWGDKIPANLRSPFRDGSEKSDYEGFDESVVFVRASTTGRPGVVDRSVTPITDETEVYGGCYARAVVHAFAYETNGNRGVSFGLQNVQKLRDGKSFSGRSKPEDDFDALPDDGSAAPEAAAGDSMFD